MRAAARGGASVVAALLLAGSWGCELVTDLDAHDYSLEQSGAACPSIGSSSGQLTTGDPSCDTCLATQCCSATTSCFGGSGGDGGGSECAQLELCTLACPTEDAGSCRSACIGNYLGGLAGAASLSTCVATSCATSCPTL